jgi:putative NIF3 family GTP cyclohydrolase 1 type 2
MRLEHPMNLKECNETLLGLFNPETLLPDEYGVIGNLSIEINRIGFATNLTPEIITLAAAQEVDLIITHHDVWEFMYDMKEYCAAELERTGIAHIYAHLPLDAADFGSAAALANVLKAKIVNRFGPYEGFLCGVIAVLDPPIDFDELVERMEKVCEEKVRSWKNNPHDVRQMGIFPGGCTYTSYVKECVENNCDVMVTGEVSMYSIQYALFKGLNLISGSHTFTEIFGVEALVKRLITGNDDIQAVKLNESHLESFT